MSSDYGQCVLCKKTKLLDDLMYLNHDAVCKDGCNILEPGVDPVEVFESDNVLITKFIAKYCIKKKFNPAERAMFLKGLQVGVGLARAISTDTLDTFTGE